MGEQLLTAIQVAEMLGLNPSHLERLRHQGKGPVCIKLGYRTVLYAPSAVQAWVEAQTQRPMVPQPVAVEGNRRSAAPRLAVRCCGVLPPRAGGAASAAGDHGRWRRRTAGAAG